MSEVAKEYPQTKQELLKKIYSHQEAKRVQKLDAARRVRQHVIADESKQKLTKAEEELTSRMIHEEVLDKVEAEVLEKHERRVGSVIRAMETDRRKSYESTKKISMKSELSQQELDRQARSKERKRQARMMQRRAKEDHVAEVAQMYEEHLDHKEQQAFDKHRASANHKARVDLDRRRSLEYKKQQHDDRTAAVLEADARTQENLRESTLDKLAMKEQKKQRYELQTKEEKQRNAVITQLLVQDRQDHVKRIQRVRQFQQDKKAEQIRQREAKLKQNLEAKEAVKRERARLSKEAAYKQREVLNHLSHVYSNVGAPVDIEKVRRMSAVSSTGARGDSRRNSRTGSRRQSQGQSFRREPQKFQEPREAQDPDQDEDLDIDLAHVFKQPDIDEDQENVDAPENDYDLTWSNLNLSISREQSDAFASQANNRRSTRGSDDIDRRSSGQPSESGEGEIDAPQYASKEQQMMYGQGRDEYDYDEQGEDFVPTSSVAKARPTQQHASKEDDVSLLSYLHKLQGYPQEPAEEQVQYQRQPAAAHNITLRPNEDFV